MLTEAELIRIYREHNRPLYTFVSRRVGGDRGLAEDIVQDTWLKAVGSWRKKGAPDSPRAWLVRVARNSLVSHFRRRRPLLVGPAELDLADESVNLETPCTAALVNWGLARLRSQQAQLLEAFYFEGKSTREIAKELGLSERAVEGRLRRARRNLERHLRPYVSAEAPSADPMERKQAPEAVLELSEGGKKHA